MLRSKPMTSSLLTAFAIVPSLVFANGHDSGDTAWMLTSTALVLFMTLPGLALFYSGLVRSRNVLSLLMQCFAIACAASIFWMLIGYTLFATDGGGANGFIGGLGKVFLSGIGTDSLAGTYPETVFVMFQMTFAIITPALIVGGFAERMRFSSMLLFSMLWLLVVYVPIAHWVWGGGWLADLGFMDFAGGAVVHVNAGVAALVAALVMGNRKGFPTTPMPPHNLPMTVTGACHALGRLVRLQCRQCAGGRRRGGHGNARHPHRRGRGLARVDGSRVGEIWQTECAGHRDGHGSRPRHHYSGVRLRGDRAGR